MSIIIVKVADNDKDKNDAFFVREQVFIKEQKVSVEIQRDEFDHYEDTIHFIAYDKNLPIAAGRARPIDDYIKFERICVLANYRNKNIGTILYKKMEEYLLMQGKTKYQLASQMQATNFYTKLGYNAISEAYIEADILHILMQKEV